MAANFSKDIGRTSLNPSLSRRQIVNRLLSLSILSSVYPLNALATVTADTTIPTQAKKRVLITGSSSGLGFMAANMLAKQGHHVTVHGRSEQRTQEILQKIPDAEAGVYGDFASLQQVRTLAEQANKLGRFDAVIHNAAVGTRESSLKKSAEGYPEVFAINTLAPYVLTALMQKPRRLIYMSSSMQFGVNGDEALDDLLWQKRQWQGYTAYSESKFFDSVLAFSVARLWPEVISNTVDPGWVPTRMGGSGAPDDLHQGYLTQCWLAVSDEPAATVSGHHFHHMQQHQTNPDALNQAIQARFLMRCEELTGIKLPT
ncbi:SDR family NAD(P)-dependent oxidoreductase [Salmonella enterica]|uniref:SDR family NAD(P)-dependent oxidoreductase n=1 Tax=Salmonella enterica TaxID=28901 RepID=A0A5U2K3V7_SALER|nr:SDR family NAD(P)-dependent oxidoreductase [Salmonella enterica]EBP3896326.1 SDR family NAD(P)-dependent oxidoreductase [Salmonella enterica subsp. enterica]EKB3222617.1 SDR family NAD(P)-dependent oxidoreductase [Salmonella enterica subsp. enterica serovar Gaminara]EAM3156696.1 short-chain dehydrogenase [Salmonella enterica]EAM8498301.1 SDR family NAD(P)-dependent oxidoreductase [Salmonella enterica]